MSVRPLVLSAVALGIVCFALPGRAQENAGAAPEMPEVLPPAGDNGDASNAPDKSEAPKAPAAGYAYGDERARSSVTRRSRYRKSGPVVNTPGFEETGDGGSRFFVQLSQNVPVEERKAQGSITYVLKGASPGVWNNTNPLVTVHFNTPVSRARLVPHGRDLFFVLELRTAVTPTWKITESQDKGAMLTIDFPTGDYLHASAEAAASGASSSRESAKPHGKRAGVKPTAPKGGGTNAKPPSAGPKP